MKVDVIIPVYGPGNRLLELFDRLGRQTVPVDRLIIMNTEKYLWDKWAETLEPGRLPRRSGRGECQESAALSLAVQTVRPVAPDGR